VSRRRQGKNLPSPPATPPAAEKADKDEQESRWHSPLAVALLAALVSAAVSPFASMLTAEYFESRKKSQLVFRSSENVMSDATGVIATIENAGRGPAKDVAITVESAPATFEFDPTHVHASPPVPFVPTVTKGRLEIKLTTPLGQNQIVSFFLDRLPLTDSPDPMFMVWASSDAGLAYRQGHAVRSHPSWSEKKFLSEYAYVRGETLDPPKRKNAPMAR